MEPGKGEGGRGGFTASLGFSAANLEIHARILFRVSGGMMLSMKDWPRLARPVTVPWREPVRPDTASAMMGRVLFRRLLCLIVGLQDGDVIQEVEIDRLKGQSMVKRRPLM